MDDLVVEGRSQNLAGLVGMQAADGPGVGGGVVGQAAGELVAGGVANARRRPPSRTRPPPRRCRWPAGSCSPIRWRGGRRRRPRSGPAAGRSGRSSACGRGGVWPWARKSVPTGSPARIRVSGSRPCPRGDDHRAARLSHQPGGRELAPHPAGAQRAAGSSPPGPGPGRRSGGPGESSSVPISWVTGSVW